MIFKTTFKELGEKSVTTYSRELIVSGVNPDTRLEVYRDKDEPDLIVTNIGECAQYRIVNEKLVKWRPQYDLKGPKITDFSPADKSLVPNPREESK